MNIDDGKKKFIQAWGTLGSSWGINKAMAQIHALLLVSPRPLTTDEIMAELSISRGNANMNIRALLDWGIIYKESKPGERKEFFKSEKDILELARQVSRERRRREIEPIVKTLDLLKNVKEGEKDEVKEFQKVVSELSEFTHSVDSVIEKFVRSDKHWFYNKLLKYFM